MNIGCQTITFGEDQRDRFDAVFDTVAKAGYTGVEIGYRRIAGYDFARLEDQLASRGLTLFASHIGGNLEDAVQAADERSLLDTVLDDLERLGVGVLMYSGLNFEDDEQFTRDVAMINRSANIARDRGVELLYHNHNWEFLNDQRVFRGLLESGGDALGFCPDVGWIFKGGVPIIDTLDSIRGRIGVVHFKDFASPGTGAVPEVLDTVEFGDGMVPLGEVASWVRKYAPDAWVVAEQDRSAIEAGETVIKNGRYLQSLFEEG